MKNAPCSKLPAVRKALKNDFLSAEVRRHCESCNDCQEEIRIYQWLQTFNAVQSDEEPPVTPQLLRIKAQLSARQAARKNAFRPLVYIYTTLQLLFSIGFLAFFWINRSTVQRWFDDSSFEAFVLSPGAMSGASFLIFTAIIFSVVALVLFSAFTQRK